MSIISIEHMRKKKKKERKKERKKKEKKSVHDLLGPLNNRGFILVR